MSDTIQLFKQINPNSSCEGCLKLGPIECADYLLWLWDKDKKAKVDFAMRDDNPHCPTNWWGIKIAYEFDFTAILCGHYGEFGDDFEAKAMDTLMDEYRCDEDVALCETLNGRQVLTIGKYLSKLSKDHGGNPDYLFCEISADMREWLTKVKEKEIIEVPVPMPEKPEAE